MSLKTSSCICVTILLLLSGVLGVKDWKVTYKDQKVCASKGSSVTILCSYQYPKGYTVKNGFWINERETDKESVDLIRNPHYSHRVTYLGDHSENCSFRIKDVTESDSATYWFRFITNDERGKWIGEPGVTLSVTDLQVETSQQSGTSRVRLTCKNTCSPYYFYNFYIWYRNGQIVPSEYDSVLETEEDGLYSCALRRFQDIKSASVEVYVEYSPKDTSVSVSPSGEILEGSSVTLTCSSKAKPPVDTYTWFKNGAEISQSGSWQNYYTISNIRPEDSGRYCCVATNRRGTGTATEYTVIVLYSPKNTSVSVSPSGDIVEGSSVTLTCNSKANPPVHKYTWFKNGAEMSQGGSWQNYNIINIRPEDSGQYSCDATNSLGIGRSTLYTVDVQYSPKNTSVSVSPSGDIVEGSSVTLTCNSKANPPVDTYTWFKNGADISQRGSMQDYNITNIRPEDSGQYYCDATNSLGAKNSTLYSINVLYAPKNTSVSVSPSGEILKDSSVTLTCNSEGNPPVDTYTWFKSGAEISQREQNYYTITNVTSEDSGEYYCEASNKVGTHKSNKVIFNIDGKQAPVIGSVGGITAVVVLVVLIVVVWKRGKWSKATKETESTQHGAGVYSDPLNETYTSLDVKTLDSDYDTLKGVYSDPINETYTSLDMKTLDSDYDTLKGVYSDPINETYTSLDMKTLDSDYDTLKTIRGTISEANPEK